MKQKNSAAPILKGLAFPIGYTVFMNVFQGIAIGVIAVLCLARAFVGLIAVPEMSMDAFMNHFAADYANMATNNTWFLSALTTVSALLILWFVFNRKGTSFREYFRFTPAPAKALIAAALLGLGLFFISGALVNALNEVARSMLEWAMNLLSETGIDTAPLQEYIQTLLDMMNQMYDGFGMFTIAAIFGAPLIEELAFRAGPLTHLTKRMPAFPAVLITAGLFALAHGNPIQMIYTFALGVIAGYLFIKSDSIYPAIVCHFVFNAANLISMALDSLFVTESWLGTGIDSHLYVQLMQKLDSWSTATFWIYTVLSCVIAIPMIGIGLFMLVKLHKPVQRDAEQTDAQAAPSEHEPAVVQAEQETMA